MNLLEDAWIPVRSGAQTERQTLPAILTADEDWRISLPRDDMEMAALQLLVALVQAVLPPADGPDLRERVRSPVDPDTFDQAIKSYYQWFRLDHPSSPFMQSRGVSAKDLTPIQKLFAGLPEGNNHALFNAPGEVLGVCGGCAAIALYNQAANCPGFGGGFKSGLRGGAPVTTLVAGENLRETVWLNVLCQTERERLYGDADQDEPNWIAPVRSKERLAAGRIGLLRGLFWQPARVELADAGDGGDCDACGMAADYLYTALRKEKFVYDVDGLWLHPHSPRVWDIKKGERNRMRYLSFTTTAPAWTWLSHYLIAHEERAEGGRAPAPVISQFREVFAWSRSRKERRFLMLVAGYRVNQAAVLERRHELYSLPWDWQVNEQHVEQAVFDALHVCGALRRMAYKFAKNSGAKVHEDAERRFYQATGPMVHQLLRDMDRREAKAVVASFGVEVRRRARAIFEDLTAAYRHTPQGMLQYARFRRGLEREMGKYARKEERAA